MHLKETKMSFSSDSNSVYASLLSVICATITLSSIQPILTLIASVVAIGSGLYSFIKKSKKKWKIGKQQ